MNELAQTVKSLSLSAVLIAKDEERDLPGALESLKGLADEIVVMINADSRDGTEALSRRAGARVAVRAFDNYAGQRNAALALAAQRWALWLDCDERVSPGLKAEISEQLRSAGHLPAAYSIPFEIWFLGRKLRFGGLGRERHVRLFRRDAGQFISGTLHERLEINGQIKNLKSPIIHEPYRDISDYLSKLDRYTTLAARKKFESGARFEIWHYLIFPWEFFSRAFLKLGILDGFPGLLWASLSAFHSWLKYAKLSEMQKGIFPR